MWASAECYINQVKLPCVFSSRLVIQNQGSLGRGGGGCSGMGQKDGAMIEHLQGHLLLKNLIYDI